MAPPSPKLTPAEISQGFRVRQARRGDADALTVLLREFGYPLGSDVATVHWVISHPEIEVFVAADPQDKPMGMVTLSHRPQLSMRGRIGTVDELIVMTSWRGKGVGKALLQRVVDRARALSVKRLELSAQHGRNETLKKFYLACGFTECATLILRHGPTETPR